MKKYKILYINDHGGWGGAEKIVLTLVKSLDRQQYEPHFILGSAGLLAQLLQAEGFSVHIIPMKPMSIPASKRLFLPLLALLFAWRLAWYTFKIYLVARHIRPDLIQTCSIHSKIPGSLVSKMVSTRLLWHVQTMQPAGFRRKLVHFLAKRLPDMIVATSQAVADIYTNIVPGEKLQVNHAGINLADFAGVDRGLTRSCLNAELKLTQSKVVVFASMLRPGKGAHVLVRAAAEIIRNFSDVIFLLVGDAQFKKDYEYKDQLVGLVSQLELAENVRFLGFRKDVYHIIAAADCLVHCPTEYDSLPTVVLEAMALQTPVVGTVIGGIPEEIDDQVTGLLVEPGNYLALAEAILSLLENTPQVEQLTKAARCKFEQEFSHQRFVNRFENIYSNLLS